jgi:hypothetical protein
VAAALLDFVFKLEAVTLLGRGDNLLRFFAIYYAAVSIVTFLIQVFATEAVLERLGLAAATATPALAGVAGGAAALVFPGLPSMIVTRGSESALRGSLFRAGYEILYTPVAADQRRAAKSIIDVGCDRLGDAIGGALVIVAQLVAWSRPQAIVGLAVMFAALALIASTRLRRGYVATLERSLLSRAVELDLTDVHDLTTRTAMFRALGAGPTSGASAPERVAAPAAPSRDDRRDPELGKISELRSRDAARVRQVLHDREGVTAALVPHIIPLLAWDEVAGEAIAALQAVAEERIGELTDALLDRNQPFAVRRRLARVLSVCVSQRAVDGLLAALDDPRFEVRVHCGQSLSAILDGNALVRVDRALVLDAVHREVGVSSPVWRSRQLLDPVTDAEAGSALDRFVNARADQSLAHVFTLLSLTLPREPLRIAFRGLQTGDARLRGTALEYLEHVLPASIRERLWPFLDAPLSGGTMRPRSEVVADLIRSNPSIMMSLEELRRRHDAVEKP